MVIMEKAQRYPEMKQDIKAEWIKRIKENKVRGMTALDILIKLYHDKTGNLSYINIDNGFPSFEIRNWCGLPRDVAINIFNMTNMDKMMLVEIASYLERDVHL